MILSLPHKNAAAGSVPSLSTLTCTPTQTNVYSTNSLAGFSSEPDIPNSKSYANFLKHGLHSSTSTGHMNEGSAEFKKTSICYNKTNITMFLGDKFRLYNVEVKFIKIF
jgi:hypothetical protein